MTHGYLLGEELGSGGMGRVIAATRTWDGRKVALKMLHPRLCRHPLARRTIATEALATTALAHENVTTVLDLDEHPEHGLFVVSELVAGRPLRALLDEQPELAHSLAILRDVLKALRAAHAAGIVHGDLKPANVLVDAAGHVKVCDFGIAQIMAPLARGVSRREAAGTPRYMAPEQFRAGITLDPRTDVYAFGVMLYEVLYGQSPFPRDLGELLGAKARPPAPPAIMTSGHAAPFALRALAASAMHPEMRQRPRFAAEALACVEAALASLDESGPASWSPRVHRAAGVPTAIEDAAEGLGTAWNVDLATWGPHVSGSSPDDRSDGEVAPLDDPPAPASGGSASLFGDPVSPGATAILETRLHALSAAMGTERKTAPGTFPSRFVPTSHLPGTALVHVRPPPLVGREIEQARLAEVAASVVAERKTRIVLLTGPSGIGKSRLAAWIASEVETQGTMESASARFSSHAGPSSGGLRGMVAALFAPSAADLAAAVRSSVAWMGRAPSSAVLDEERLGLWLEEGGSADAADPHGTASLAMGALCAYAAARPILLWFDDLASAEDGSVELLARLAEEAPDVPILAVATVSDEAAEDAFVATRLAPIAARALSLPLAPLEIEARTRLLERMLPLAPGVAARAALRVGGHPLFIVQQVEQWVEARTLRHTDDGLDLVGEELERYLDRDALIAGRIDAHFARAPEAVPVLHLLALLGPYGGGDALAKACAAHGLDASILDLVIEEGLLAGILRARADEVGFAHASLRAVTLDRCRAEETYAAFAASAAQAIFETAAVGRPSARAYVAVLLRDAGEHDRSFETIVAAIEAMAHGGDDAQAARLLVVVRRWEAEAPPDVAARHRDEIDYVEARTAYFRNEFPRAREVLDALIARLRVAPPTETHVVRLARALGLLGHADFYAGDVARAEAILRGARTQLGVELRPGSAVENPFADLEGCIASMRGDADVAFDAYLRHVDTDVPWMRWIFRSKLAEVEAARGRHDSASTFLLSARHESGPLDVYQMRYQRELDAKIALARGERRDRRIYEELVRSHGDTWGRTSARLALAAWDATFDPAAMVPAAQLALDAFEQIAHDEMLSHAFLRRIADVLGRVGHDVLAERARSLLAARLALATTSSSAPSAANARPSETLLP